MIAVMISTILVMNKILGVHLAMVAYTKPQQRKKEESERLRGEREMGSSLMILDSKEGKF